MRHRNPAPPANSATPRRRRGAPYALGADIGGTKILVGLVDRGGRVRAALRVATPDGPEAAAGAIVRARDVVARRAGVPMRHLRNLTVGAGVPGPIDPAAGVVDHPPNLRGWGRVAIRDLLARALDAPVVIENDANAAAYGEWRAGAGRGARDLVYVTISTGIGGGLILGGRLHRGAAGTAGEIGHTVIDLDGHRCSCGRLGHLEGIAAGPAIARAAADSVAAGRVSLLSAASPLNAEAVARAAASGDALAREVLGRAGRCVGLAIGSLINVLSPEVIVVGGGVLRAGPALWTPLRAAAAETSFPLPYGRVRIVRAALGARAGLIGAALVALDGVDERT
jgi:glucokinase